MKRRKFLKNCGHAISAPLLLNTLGVESFAKSLSVNPDFKDRVLVMIYLDGGNDGLNTVIPLDRLSELNALRSNVMIKDSDMIKLSNTSSAFHPAFESLVPAFNENKLGIIQNVGYPNPDLSHFRSNDVWMSGSDGDEHVDSGWMGRFLSMRDLMQPIRSEHPLAAEMGYENSMLFEASKGKSVSCTVGDPEIFYDFVNIDDLTSRENLMNENINYIRYSRSSSIKYGGMIKEKILKAGKQIEYPNSELAQKLRTVSSLISGGLETSVYLVRLEGFDTHMGQVYRNDPTKGRHPMLMKTLSDAIAAFLEDIDQLGIGDRVIGMTYSEMGRRIKSNASFGTDHGTAAPLFVFGNSVKGGVYGDNPYIDKHMGKEDNLEMQYDCRQVYNTVLRNWFGASDDLVKTTLFSEFKTIPFI